MELSITVYILVVYLAIQIKIMLLFFCMNCTIYTLSQMQNLHVLLQWYNDQNIRVGYSVYRSAMSLLYIIFLKHLSLKNLVLCNILLWNYHKKCNCTVHNTQEDLAKETEPKKVVSLLKDTDCLSTQIEVIKNKIKIKMYCKKKKKETNEQVMVHTH